ncbi:MAG: ribonuclease HI [Desulfobacterales bacterium]|nr:MAG: ribonuclease HI [Desulfobacterales bacterium]
MKNRPGWKRMMFKGHKVWLHVNDDQQPVVHDHKLLIKYQLDQDHEYWVPKDAVRPIDPKRLRKKVPKERPDRQPSLSADPNDLHDRFPPRTIVAHTDGASAGNPGPAGIGIVLRYGPHEKEISKHIGIATNNVAELTAIKTALKAIHTTEIPVRLYTDSQYCLGLLSLGWKPKRNEKLVATIRKLMGRFKDFRILKIEAHAGIDDNERADRLAREAVRGPAVRKGRKM